MGCQRTEIPVSDTGDAIAPLLRALGAKPTALHAARFQRYEAMLIEHGSRFNLTSVLQPAAIRARHFAESLAIGVALHERGLLPGRGRAVDVGSGAGFPGLPLAIALPDLRFTLIEATRKKAAFLALVAEELKLGNVDVVPLRAEEAARRSELRETFDVALARAVARLNTLAELLLPFVRLGGCMAAVKGSRAPAELEAARAAVQRCGGGEPALLPLPGAPPELRLVVAGKERPTPRSYPRRAGVPAHEPLR